MPFLNQNSLVKGFIILVILIYVVSFFILVLQRNRNLVLEKALKQNQEIIEQKEREIQNFRQEIEELQKIQSQLESKVIHIKSQKSKDIQRIELLKNNEVCNEFQKFGYNPICR